MIKQIKRAADYLSDFDVTSNAASASFFIVLSVFPLTALVLSLLRYLPVGPEDLLAILSDFLPGPILPLVDYLFNDLYASNVLAVVSLTVVVAMWSASRGVFGILNGVSHILGGEDHRSYFRRRLTAVFYTLFLILAVLLTLGLQVFSKKLLGMVARWNVRVYHILAQILRLRFVFTAAFLALLFMLLYAFFPARRMRLRDVVPGAVFTSVGWLAFSFFFSIYVNYGGGSRFYGSMAVAMLSLLWLHICMSILFYGAVICRLSRDGLLGWKALKAFLSAPEQKPR